jgi:hypothetical protein
MLFSKEATVPSAVSFGCRSHAPVAFCSGLPRDHRAVLGNVLTIPRELSRHLIRVGDEYAALTSAVIAGNIEAAYGTRHRRRSTAAVVLDVAGHPLSNMSPAGRSLRR